MRVYIEYSIFAIDDVSIPWVSHRGEGSLTLMLLRLANLPGRLRQVLLLHVLALVPDSEHARLGDHVPQVSAIEAVGELWGMSSAFILA